MIIIAYLLLLDFLEAATNNLLVRILAVPEAVLHRYADVVGRCVG